MKLDHGIARKRARVEMIPLIDCVFILLVFFIYSMLAMTLQRGIVVNLPAASALATEREEAVVISIDEGGAVYLDREPIPLERLGPAAETETLRRGNPRVVINAEARCEHRVVVRVLDELRAHGVTQVMIRSTDASEAP